MCVIYKILCTNRKGKPTSCKDKGLTCCLLFPLYLFIAWAACVYTFLHQGKEKDFVEVSRFIFEAIGLITMGLSSLWLPGFVNHAE